jgi:hypothetical protein
MDIHILSSPLQKVKVQNIVKYIVRQVTVQLFSGCTIAISLVDANDNLVEDMSLTMKQTDYDLWNTDDAYIVDWINTQLHGRYSSTEVESTPTEVEPTPTPTEVESTPTDEVGINPSEVEVL